MDRIRITETTEIDLDREMWCCGQCHTEIYTARESYLKGCLVYERPAEEIYGPPIHFKANPGFVSYAADTDFMRILEFYCPGCGALITVQYLPPGHPIVMDIQLDLDKLKRKTAGPGK
jgi:acetophenone carboxylase